MEKTFAMVKPNAVKAGLIGHIIARYESARLSVVAIRFKQMTQKDAEGFYAEHVGKGFFPELAKFMTSGPSVQLVLAGENAIAKVRAINGANKSGKGGTRHHTLRLGNLNDRECCAFFRWPGKRGARNSLLVQARRNF